MPEELDKRKKLMKKDIDLLKKLDKKGYSREELASLFNVTKTCIRYHTDDEYRKYNIDGASKRELAKRKHSKYKKLLVIKNNVRIKKRKEIQPEYKEYINAISRKAVAKYNKNNREKNLECQKKWRENNKEHLKQYYLDNKEKYAKRSRDWYIKNRRIG